MAQELTVQGEDGFDVQERSGNFIIGGMIKYHNHVYTLNKTEPVPPDITLLVIRIITCWVRWWDHAPTEHRVTRSGQLHPQRDDLPDQDETLWQLGLDGKNVADPWKDTRYMHLINLQTGQDYTLVTDTNGGRMAVGELKSSIGNVRRAHPEALPIIKFGDGTFKSKQFGEIPRPVLIIVSWHKGLKEVPAQSDQQLLAPAKEKPDAFAKSAEKPTEQIVSELPPVSLAEEMDDAIPNFDEGTEKQATKAMPPSRPRRELEKSPTKAGGKPPSKKRNILDAG
jgi:hypothetical protein